MAPAPEPQGGCGRAAEALTGPWGAEVQTPSQGSGAGPESWMCRWRPLVAGSFNFAQRICSVDSLQSVSEQSLTHELL